MRFLALGGECSSPSRGRFRGTDGALDAGAGNSLEDDRLLVIFKAFVAAITLASTSGGGVYRVLAAAGPVD